MHTLLSSLPLTLRDAAGTDTRTLLGGAMEEVDWPSFVDALVDAAHARGTCELIVCAILFASPSGVWGGVGPPVLFAGTTHTVCLLFIGVAVLVGDARDPRKELLPFSMRGLADAPTASG